MLEKILTVIRETDGYLATLAAYNRTEPLTEEAVRKLFQVYRQYIPEVNPGPDPEDSEYIRHCLAVDLLPGRERDNPDFSLLGLNEKTLDALFEARDIIAWKTLVNPETIQRVRLAVEDKSVTLPVRAMLARGALDAAVSAQDCAAMQEDISALAAFLIQANQECPLDYYLILVREVRIRCK